MPSARPVTLRQYYKAFRGLWGILASLITVFPAASLFLPAGVSTCVFPPLGNVEPTARIGAVLLLVGTTYGAFFSYKHRTTGSLNRVSVAFAFAVVSLCLYLALYLSFVRRIDIPSQGAAVYVTVGYDRTDFARATFGAASDWDLLRQRGVDEEQIYRLWTTRSVVVARLALFASYCGLLLPFVAALGWGVLYELTESHAKNPGGP